MKNEINRRQFLNLLSLFPLAYLVNQETGTSPINSHDSPTTIKPPNILLLVYDTFSARHCSLYGYPRKTTPNLDRIADRATVYHRHYAPANFTSPGTASLLTGMYPGKHRCIHLHGTVADQIKDGNIFKLLSEKYHTFAYTHNPQAAILLKQFNQGIHELTKISELCLSSHSYADKILLKDFPLAYESELLLLRNAEYPSGSLFFSLFEKAIRILSDFQVNKRYRDKFPLGVPNFYDEEKPSFLYFTLEDATNWIFRQVNEKPQPFFGYIHMLPPHGPYTPPRDTYEMFTDNYSPVDKPSHFFSHGIEKTTLDLERRKYDEFIVYVDAEIGRILDELEKSGALDNTVIIITSDHGELFERGINSHITPLLYESLIHIPLIVLSPGQKSRVDIHSLTSSVDILPTLAGFAGVTVSEHSEGIPLPFFAQPSPFQSSRAVYALEAKQSSKFGALTTATGVVIQEQYKLISYFGYQGHDGIYELYDLDNDPEELENLIQAKPELFEEMKTKLLTQMNYQSNR